MTNAFANWRTTSLGISTIGLAVIHLAFLIKAGRADEESWAYTFGQILVGLGLILAGDAARSASKDSVQDVQEQVDRNTQAIVTGDNSELLNRAATEPPTKG